MKILLGPLQKLGNLFEENATATKEMHVALSLDLKEASKSNNDLLKEQTSVLLDIKKLLAEGSKKEGKKEKGSGFKMPNLMGGLGAGLAIAAMAAAILGAAGILSFMPVLSGGQILTALAIGGLFALLAPTFVAITKTLNGGGVMESIAGKFAGVGTGKPESMASAATGVGLAMVSMALAITATSWILQMVIPLDPIKAISAVLIGLAFIPLSVLFGNLIQSLNGFGIGGKAGTAQIFQAGLAMAVIAVAISAVALIFNMMMPSKMIDPPPIGWSIQAGLVMIAFSFSFAMIAKAVGGVGLKKLSFLPVAYALVAGSIVVTALAFSLLSWVGAYNAPPLEWTFKAGLSILLFSASFAIIAKALNGVKLKKISFLPLVYGLIGASIAATALAFSLLSWVGAYNAPPLEWTLKAGLAILLFSASFALIAKAVNGLTLKGLVSLPFVYGLIAAGILATAFIFTYLDSVGAYNAPPLDWTLKAGLAILIFSGAFALIANTAGKVGTGALIKAGIAIPVIALSILAVSYIFGLLGGVEGWHAPPLEWSLKAGLAIAVFGVAFVAVALMATVLTPVSLLLGAAGVILIAGTMWVVSWIFSKIPEGAAAGAATLSKVIFAPMNEMVNVFKRFKDEIGIENLIPLGKGLIAVSAGYLSLAGAMTGTAIGGVISGIIGAGKKVLDFITFGATKTDTPFELLDKLSERLPQIKALAPHVYALGTGMQHIAKHSEAGVAGIAAILRLGESGVSKNLGTSRNHIRGIANSYGVLATNSNLINVSAVDATTRMFNAIARMSEADGEDAMSVLAKELMKAVNELSEVVERMENTSVKQSEGMKGALDGVLTGFLDKIKGTTKDAGEEEAAGLIDIQPIVDAIQELEERFSMPIRVKAT